jgi:hypothetical protein
MMSKVEGAVELLGGELGRNVGVLGEALAQTRTAVPADRKFTSPFGVTPPTAPAPTAGPAAPRARAWHPARRPRQRGLQPRGAPGHTGWTGSALLGEKQGANDCTWAA